MKLTFFRKFLRILSIIIITISNIAPLFGKEVYAEELAKLELSKQTVNVNEEFKVFVKKMKNFL